MKLVQPITKIIPSNKLRITEKIETVQNPLLLYKGMEGYIKYSLNNLIKCDHI